MSYHWWFNGIYMWVFFCVGQQSFLGLLLCITDSDGSKILGIFPFAARSHFTCNNAIMRSLIESGHEVTVFTPFTEQASKENYTSINQVPFEQIFTAGSLKIDELATQNPFKIIQLKISIEQRFCTQILNSAEIQKILHSEEKLYDVLFVEMSLLYKCFFPIAEKLKIPIIGTVAFKNYLAADLAIHNPNHPAYIQFEMVTQKWNVDRILGRIMNAFNHIVLAWHQYFIIPKLVTEIYENSVDNFDVTRNSTNREPDIIFYNSHSSLFPRPMNPNAIEIGGIHIKEANPLPKSIQKFIDEAAHGVILFSLGSVVRGSSLSTDYRNAFRDAFAEIPQRVIWKFEETIENLPRNVMLLDWLPQRDILEHKNVKAFISHCGLGSVNEAVYTGTPIIACPLFCDQPDNSELLENAEVAVPLDIHDITKENVLDALKAITNDTRYYNNMQKLSKQFKDRSMTAQQSVVYWTEYVIRHDGASHLKSPASRLSWFQFLMLDVIFIITFFIVSFVYLTWKILRNIHSPFIFFGSVNKFEKPVNKKI